MIRNSNNRDGITAAQFGDAYRALAFANCQGFIMDTALDVTWSLHGIRSEADVAALHAQFLQHVHAWFVQHDLPALYLWVLEEGPTYGLHSHIVLHLPPELEAAFRCACSEALSGLVRAPLLETDESKTMLLQVRGGQTTAAQWDRFRYMLKGIDAAADCIGGRADGTKPSLREVARINYDFQGFIETPRIGISDALGPSARAHFSAQVPLPDMPITPETPPLYNDTFLHWYQANLQLLDGLGLSRAPRPSGSTMVWPAQTPPG